LECLARRLHNSHDATNRDGRITGNVQLLELSCSAGDSAYISVHYRHQIRIAKDFQPAQPAEIGAFQRRKAHVLDHGRSLLGRRINALDFQ
jgi:hypothetical protein